MKAKQTEKQRIRRLEIFLLVFQGALAVALIGVWSQPHAPRSLLIHLIGSMILLVLCRSFSPKDPFVRGFCEWGYLYPFILISYLATGKLIPFYWEIGQANDVFLAWVDGAVFGVTPELWKSGINHPLIVELCAYGYVSYFLFGILLVGSLYHQYNATTKVFATAFTSVVTAFYLSYLGYWIYPAQGPRYIWKEMLEPLQGYALANYAFNSMDDVSLGFYDAFPSEHTMFSIIAAVIWWRYNRKMFWVMLPFLATAIAATVILRYHWVTDVVVGAAMAPVVLWIADRWGLWLTSAPNRRK